MAETRAATANTVFPRDVNRETTQPMALITKSRSATSSTSGAPTMAVIGSRRAKRSSRTARIAGSRLASAALAARLPTPATPPTARARSRSRSRCGGGWLGSGRHRDAAANPTNTSTAPTAPAISRDAASITSPGATSSPATKLVQAAARPAAASPGGRSTTRRERPRDSRPASAGCVMEFPLQRCARVLRPPAEDRRVRRRRLLRRAPVGEEVELQRPPRHARRAAQRLGKAVKGGVGGVEDDAAVELRLDTPDAARHGGVPELELASPLRPPRRVQVQDEVDAAVESEPRV